MNKALKNNKSNVKANLLFYLLLSTVILLENIFGAQVNDKGYMDLHFTKMAKV